MLFPAASRRPKDRMSPGVNVVAALLVMAIGVGASVAKRRATQSRVCCIHWFESVLRTTFVQAIMVVACRVLQPAGELVRILPA